MSELGIAADVLLRLVGAYYALGGLIGLRRCAVDYLLTQAIAAIGNPDPRETAAERGRSRVLAFNLWLVGAGGIVLSALLDIAVLIFVASTLFYGFYLTVLAPRLFDKFDPPEAEGRSQTQRAFWIYLVMTTLVVAAWWAGRLRPTQNESLVILAIVAGLVVALAVYAVRVMASMKSTRPWESLADAPDDVPVEPSVEGPVNDPTEAKAVKVMADYGMYPLWRMDEVAYESIDPHQFGISVELACDLDAWAIEFDQSMDINDPGGPPRWTEADSTAHEQRGRVLAVRLVRELADRGRGDTAVYSHTRAAGVVQVHSGDSID